MQDAVGAQAQVQSGDLVAGVENRQEAGEPGRLRSMDLPEQLAGARVA